MSKKKTEEHYKSLIEWFNKSSDQCFRLGGLAGTGKTTLIKDIHKHLKLKKCDIAFCAYTGKAAHVMRKKGLNGASTIHSLMYAPLLDEDDNLIGFERVEISKDVKLVVVDESSMVNEEIHEDLLEEDVKILYVGDYGQLPPVKSEFNLMSEDNLDYKLTKIHRQAEGSGILQLAMQARSGHKLKVGSYGKDKEAVVVNRISVKSIMNADQIICGKNDTRHYINRIYREQLGYDDTDAHGIQLGEKIIINCNNKKFNIYNGQQFIVIKKYNGKKPTITVMESHDYYADDKIKLGMHIKNYDKKLIKTFPYKFASEFIDKKHAQIDYGYCITCHKSQGSEWEKVMVFDENYIFREHSNKWLYTAITRASEKLIIVKNITVSGVE